MATSLLTEPTRSAHSENIAALQAASPMSLGTSTFIAPARFDVHEANAFRRWVTDRRYMGETALFLDCSNVVFIDQTAVDTIEAARTAGSTRVTIVRASTATRITFELLAGSRAQEVAA